MIVLAEDGKAVELRWRSLSNNRSDRVIVELRVDGEVVNRVTGNILSQWEAMAEELQKAGDVADLAVAIFALRDEVGSGLMGGEGAEGLRVLTLEEMGEGVEDAEERRLWGPYLSRGELVIFYSYPKFGKSTLLAHVIAKATNGGGELVYPVKPMRVLVVTEEPKHLWHGRGKRLGFGEGLGFLPRSMTRKVSWEALVEGVEKFVDDGGFDLVVWDTLTKLARVDEENDAGVIAAVVGRLEPMADNGTCQALLAHARKSAGKYGQNLRGSSAYLGVVDGIIEIQKTGEKWVRRLVSVASRSDADVADVCLELVEGEREYVQVEDRKKSSGGGKTGGRKSLETERLEAVDGLLPAEAPGMTVAEILERWPVGVLKPSPSTLKDTVADGWKAGRYARGQRKGQGPNPAYEYLLHSRQPLPMGFELFVAVGVAKAENPTASNTPYLDGEEFSAVQTPTARNHSREPSNRDHSRPCVAGPKWGPWGEAETGVNGEIVRRFRRRISCVAPVVAKEGAS